MKQVWKLTYKCFFVMLPLIIFCLFARFGLMLFADWEAPYYMWNRDFTHTHHETKYDVVILGDSVANGAYLPDSLSENTINLSLGGLTPVENYYTLYNWLENNEAPKDVFMSYQDFHLSIVECFWSRAMYAHLLPTSQCVEIIEKGMEFEDETVIHKGWQEEFISYELGLPDKYVTSFLIGLGTDRAEFNRKERIRGELNDGRYIGDNAIPYDPNCEVIVFDTFCVREIEDFYIRKTIELCKENDIKVHFIKLPLAPNESFTENYRIQIQSYYENLERCYNNLDFQWYEEPYEGECFVDSHHMNTRGAIRFSRFLKSEYKECFEE